MKKKLLFAINVDWYFALHWRKRIDSNLTDGFEVTVCFSESGDTTVVSEKKNYTVKILDLERSSAGFVSNLRSLYQAWKIFRGGNFALVHSATVKPNIYFGLLARLYGCPLVVSVPGLGSVFSKNGLQFKLLRAIISFLYRLVGKNNSSHFVFENRHDRKLFVTKGICRKRNSTVVCGAGIDIDEFKYTQEKSAKDGVIKILFAARLLQDKGLAELIEATGVLKKRGKNIELLVAGITDVDSKDALSNKTIENWQKDGRITFLGRVDDMASLLADVHIVALPTRYGEGLPRILIEANACGRPVIATDVPGCSDFIENGVNGLLVPVGSLNDLTVAIENLLAAEIRQGMGLAGRRLVEKYYTNEKVVSEYREIYQKLTFGEKVEKER